MSLEMKQRQLDLALDEAREIQKREDLNDEERVDLVKRVEMIEKLKAEVAEDKRIRATLAAEAGVSEEELVQVAQKALSTGAAYVKSAEYAAAKAQGFRGNAAPFQNAPIADALKAEPTVIDTVTALPNVLTPQRINQILGIASFPTTLAARLPSLDLGTAGSVTYFLEDSETDTIGIALEGAEKGNFTLAGSEQEDKAYVVAGMAALTRQTLENAAFMAGFVNTRMQLKLEKVKEDKLLNGTGTNEPAGFYHRTAPIGTAGLTVTGTQTNAQNIMDSIYLATVQGWENGGYPSDLVVMRPGTWSTIVLAKDGQDRYYGGGPFAQALGETIWGLPVCLSNFVTLHHVLVGPFGTGCSVLTRGGQQVRTSDSHSDYFKLNKVAILLEEQIGLSVYSPLAFVDLSMGVS